MFSRSNQDYRPPKNVVNKTEAVTIAKEKLSQVELNP